MRSILLKICKWIIKKLEKPRDVSDIKKRVKYWVIYANTLDCHSSYRKWEVVRKKVRSEFPSERERFINLLIELELNGL